MSRSRLGTAASLLLLACTAAACASAITSTGAETSTTLSSTTTLSRTTTTTAPPPSPPPAAGGLDWDGVVWDYGQVVSAAPEEGGIVIGFDRWQLYVGEGYVDAKGFAEEPIVYANRDEPGLNENPQIRRYRLAPNAELLYLANAVEVCDDEFGPVAPVWASFTPVELVARSVPGLESHQTALTFDTAGNVVRVRVSQSC